MSTLADPEPCSPSPLSQVHFQLTPAIHLFLPCRSRLQSWGAIVSAAVAVVVFTRRWRQWALQLVDVFPQSKLTPGFTIGVL